MGETFSLTNHASGPRVDDYRVEDDRGGFRRAVQPQVETPRRSEGPVPAFAGPAPTEIPSTAAGAEDRLIAWRREFAEYYHTMKNFDVMDVVDTFLHLSQFSARASELRSQLGTTETKKEASFRIRIIDPFIEECERQFKIHSRIQAVKEMDAKLAGGQFA